MHVKCRTTLYIFYGFILYYLVLQVYWTGPLLGGALGGFLYDIVFAPNASKERTMAFLCDLAYDGDNYDSYDFDQRDKLLARAILRSHAYCQEKERQISAPCDSFPDISDSLRSITSDDSSFNYAERIAAV